MLTFLPANKHYSFSVAQGLDALDPRPHANARLAAIEASLDLAEYDLGVPTVVRNLIASGIAVHTSAMLRDEQRASEMAFLDGQALAMFATTTLAQGLNLPATAVVVGGTRVGHDPGVPFSVRDERTRSQLLNALGRAGRAYVSSRSLGVVIPDNWIIAGPEASAAARSGASFLEYDDASTEVRSQLENLIETALGEGVVIEGMTDQEQTAFAFLAMAEPGDASEVLRRSFGAYRKGIAQDGQHASRVAESLRAAGTSFVELADAPEWIVQASHAAGIALPPTAALYRSTNARLAVGRPTTIDGWRDLLVQSIADMSPQLTAQTLPPYPFTSTNVEPLFATPPGREERLVAAESLNAILELWMNDAPLTQIAVAALGESAMDHAGRGSGHPIPKTITLVDHGLGFGMSRAAGVLAAFARFATLVDSDSNWVVDEAEQDILNLLPVAIRFGTRDHATTAWYRGFRRRRVAHLLAHLVPPPASLRDDALADWVKAARRGVLDSNGDPYSLTENTVVAALRLAEGT